MFEIGVILYSRSDRGRKANDLNVTLASSALIVCVQMRKETKFVCILQGEVLGVTTYSEFRNSIIVEDDALVVFLEVYCQSSSSDVIFL